MSNTELLKNEQFGIGHFLWRCKEVDIKEEGEYPERCGTERKEDHVGYQLKALDHLFRRTMQAMMRQNGFEDMSMMNGWIIEYLAKNEGKDIFQKDIERTFKVGKSSIAGTLKTMEEKGYIVRQAVAGDARLKRVCLTDKGRTYTHKMEQGREEMERKVCEGLTKEEISLFFRIIKKMQDNLID